MLNFIPTGMKGGMMISGNDDPGDDNFFHPSPQINAPDRVTIIVRSSPPPFQ